MKKLVSFHSDCGLYSTQFAKVTGVIKGLCENVTVEPSNVCFEKGNVPQLSAYLFTTVPYWPDNTLFLCLVGEGRPIAIKLANGSVILSPDNGTATMCVKHLGFKEAVVLKEEEFALAKAAARLANGEELNKLGTSLNKEDVCLFKMPKADIKDGSAEGEITMLLKTFGNITFSIGTDEFEGTNIKHGDSVKVTISRNGNIEYETVTTYQPSFGYVPVGEPVVFNGSSGYMDIGLNLDSFINKCLPQSLEAENIGDFKVRIEKIGE